MIDLVETGKELTFVLENCEYITIPENQILTFSLDDIRLSISDFCKMNVAQSASIMIAAEWVQSNPEQASRLTDWHDITAIELDYGGRTDYIFVNYKEAPGQENVLGAENINESHFVDSDSSLFIMMDDRVGSGEMTAESYLTSLDV